MSGKDCGHYDRGQESCLFETIRRWKGWYVLAGALFAASLLFAAVKFSVWVDSRLEKPEAGDDAREKAAAMTAERSNWTYSSKDDAFYDGANSYARLESETKAEFEGSFGIYTKRMSISLERTPDGERCTLGVKGESFYFGGRCEFDARFDGGEPVNVECSRVDDNLDLVKVSDPKKFVRALANSGECRIRVKFYDHGQKTFVFRCGGLKWD